MSICKALLCIGLLYDMMFHLLDRVNTIAAQCFLFFAQFSVIGKIVTFQRHFCY